MRVVKEMNFLNIGKFFGIANVYIIVKNYLIKSFPAY